MPSDNRRTPLPQHTLARKSTTAFHSLLRRVYKGKRRALSNWFIVHFVRHFQQTAALQSSVPLRGIQDAVVHSQRKHCEDTNSHNVKRMTSRALRYAVLQDSTEEQFN